MKRNRLLYRPETYDIDLAKLEAEMKKIAKEDLKVERYELPREEALSIWTPPG